MNKNHEATVTEFLTEGRITATPERSEWCPHRVEAEIGVTTVTFEYGRDGQWRMVYIDTYGNLSNIHGEGCDATGFVVTDIGHLELLDSLFE